MGNKDSNKQAQRIRRTWGGMSDYCPSLGKALLLPVMLPALPVLPAEALI
jgi:hypothetical protein